jgi:Dyp-type peroxidase family
MTILFRYFLINSTLISLINTSKSQLAYKKDSNNKILSMSKELQEGIYYRSKPPIGNSFCIMSLRAESGIQINEVGVTVGRIWRNLIRLKTGITSDLEVDSRHQKNGNLTVLVGYGYELFEILGSRKERPASFDNIWNFKPPEYGGGGVILDGSEMTYSTKTFSNHLLTDHLIFQFIGDNEFFTNRAAVEIWKDLHKLRKNRGVAPLRITGLYSGFQRADCRNWLGFHDGVSNIKSRERPQVISISPRYLRSQDSWTINGTYLAFMRIVTDLARWEDTSITEQEIIIGREKLTGCPLIRVNKNGKPIKDPRCPVPGTSEVIDRGNEYFREHPPYESENKILQYSHIGRARPKDGVPIWDKKSLRVFRQGFEFLTFSSDNSSLVPGLNFVSFQNTPERLFRALTYQHKIHQKGDEPKSLPNLNSFLSVLAAGIFFVPPKVQNEPFPGAGIFFNNSELRNLSRKEW